MSLGKLPVPGRPTIWMAVGKGLLRLQKVGGWSCLDIFTPASVSLSLGDSPI